MKSRLAIIIIFLLMSFISVNAYSYDVIFKIDNKQYFQNIDELNEGAAAFRKALPLTVVFENFGQNERIAYLNKKLENFKDNPHCTPVRGDLTYYVPWGNLAVFVKDFRYSENLLYITHLNQDLLEAIQKSQKSLVIIEEK